MSATRFLDGAMGPFCRKGSGSVEGVAEDVAGTVELGDIVLSATGAVESISIATDSAAKGAAPSEGVPIGVSARSLDGERLEATSTGRSMI